MNDPTRILKADHREAEALLKKLADTDEGSEREQLVAELTMKLTAHMEMEERLVYPPVAKEVGEEEREEADIEHQLARGALGQLNEMVDKPGFGAVVEMLKGGIGHHVHEEEHELLPELKEQMSREEWLALGDAIARAKQEAGLPVPQAPKRRAAKRRPKASAGKR